MKTTEIKIGKRYIFKHYNSNFDDPFNGKKVKVIEYDSSWSTAPWTIECDGEEGLADSNELLPIPLILPPRDSKGRWIRKEDADAFRKNYLANSHKCPYCKSTNITGESVEVCGGNAYQDVICMDCEKSWTDEYTLTDILEG